MSDLTVVVCTLNEQDNIVPCLNSLPPDVRLVVVDGGSTDRTVGLVRLVRPDATVVVQEGGLLKQRVRGVGETRTSLLAFVDADDRLEPDALDVAVRHLDDRGVCAVQLGFGIDRRTAVSRAYSVMLQVSHPAGQRLGMLGRPCVIATSALPPDPDVVPAVAMEDAWLHATYLTGCTVEVCAGLTVRQQPMTVREVWSKTWWYGRGDAGHVAGLGRWRQTVFHLLVQYPLLRGGRAVRAGHPVAGLLCVAVGWTRFVSACWHLMRRDWDV